MLRRFRFITLSGIIGCLCAVQTTAFAASPDAYLQNVYAALRVTGAHVTWVPNGVGGSMPMVVYDLTNLTDYAVMVPVTAHSSGTAANWVGSRQLWIERLDRDPTIPAMPRGTARRGRQYAYGGELVAWPAQTIAPRGFQRFNQLIHIGGFPSGRYAVYIEYQTAHEQRLINAQVVYFDVP